MALVFCRECGKQISDRAPSCPGCGAPIALVQETAAIPVKKRWKAKWLLGCVGAIVALFLGLTLWGALMPVEKRDQIAGCILAKHFVQAKLRAPSTADFPGCGPKFLAFRSGADLWTAKGYVDAQNLFGVKIRSTYLVKMRHTIGTKDWSPIDVSFNQGGGAGVSTLRQGSPVEGTKGV
jgi:zinc-ribbon domain